MKLISGLAIAAILAAVGTTSFAQVGPAGRGAGRAVAPAARGEAAAAARENAAAARQANAARATAAREAAAERASAAREAAAARAAEARERTGDRIDQRQANQARRIQAGIKQGQLTPDEVTRLKAMETNIETLEAALKSDGKPTKAELQQIREALNAASLQIWSERHDTEGNQMPTYRLGKNVFAQDQLTAKLESPDLTKAQAREFLKDFRKLVNLKHRLATETLTPDQRAKLQSEYDSLLTQYFITKP